MRDAVWPSECNTGVAPFVATKCKGLTRKITRKQARSYDRSVPNGRGVMALAEINGRGAYEKRYAQTRKLLAKSENKQGMYTANQRVAMKKMSARRRKAFKSMLDSKPGYSRNPIGAWVAEDRDRKRRPKRKKAAPKKKAAAKRKPATRRAAAPKRKGKRSAASYRAAAKKAAATRKRNARKAAPKKRATKKTAARRKPRTYGKGKYRALKARYGPVSRHTYMYKTKKGRARHIPSHAILGYPSAAALRKAWAGGDGKDAGRIAERTERLARRRDKASQTAARRVRRGLGIFTPNSGGPLSFEEWKKEMRPNAARKKKAKKKTTKAARRAAALKGWRKRRRGGAKKKKVAAKRKGKRTKASYRAAAKKAAATRKRNARKGGRKTTARKKKTVARKRRRVTRSFTVGRRGHKARISYAANRRRRRSYKRNAASAYMQELKGALKLGAMITVGYVGHRALTKVINDQLVEKIKYFKENENGIKYRDLFSATLTALGLIPLVMLGAKKLKVKPVPLAAGVAASFIHGTIIKALGYTTNESAQKAIPYLSAYPNAGGSAYGSYYEFQPHQMYNGTGAYYETPQMSGFGQVRQAAAGYGSSPMLTQAAAGYGASPMLTQAAAGTGEYIASGVNGIGEYEEVATSTQLMSVDEGIYPNTQTAEQALSIAEAAAGVGSADVPLQSTVDPSGMSSLIGDAPGGSRVGVFRGGDGIFG